MIIHEYINMEELKKHEQELREEYMDYIPIAIDTMLIDMVDYYNRRTREANAKHHKVRLNMPSKNITEYFLNDIIEWIEENPKYHDIIYWDKIQ